MVFPKIGTWPTKWDLMTSQKVFQLPLDAEDSDVICFDKEPCSTKFKNVFFFFYLKIQTLQKSK